MTHVVNIISFNLGYNIMSNKAIRSERKQVLNCQRKYNGGWYDDEKTISTCSHNAAELISKFDIFGLQEINPINQETFERTVQQLNMNANYDFIGHEIIIGYNKKIFGLCLLIYNDKIPMNKEAKDRRHIQMIWFGKFQLLFINTHAPHHIDLKTELKHIFRNVEKNNPDIIPKRIIMTGDFNDADNQLINVELSFYGLMLRIPSKNIVRTCCTDVDYVYAGDYIFDSHIENTIYYGLPKEYVRNEIIMSDHDPIVLITKL